MLTVLCDPAIKNNGST